MDSSYYKKANDKRLNIKDSKKREKWCYPKRIIEDDDFQETWNQIKLIVGFAGGQLRKRKCVCLRC